MRRSPDSEATVEACRRRCLDSSTRPLKGGRSVEVKLDAGLRAQWRELSNPAFETRNGTKKFSAQRTQVAAIA